MESEQRRHSVGGACPFDDTSDELLMSPMQSIKGTDGQDGVLVQIDFGQVIYYLHVARCSFRMVH
jgi:hypothetical protein